MLRWHIAPSGNACTAKEYKGFAMQPKSEWHAKAIKWFVVLLQKLVSCDIINSMINKNLQV